MIMYFLPLLMFYLPMGVQYEWLDPILVVAHLFVFIHKLCEAVGLYAHLVCVCLCAYYILTSMPVVAHDNA